MLLDATEMLKKAEEIQSTKRLISINWIGHTLYFEEGNFHESTRQALGLPEKTIEGKFGSKFHEWFGITTENEPICLMEYADKFSNDENTHVISFHDYQ